MAAYGQHLGIAFQLIDDALDFTSSKDELGKNLGDDLAEGKPTLPLIYAIENGTKEQADVIINAIKTGDRDSFNEVYEIVKATNAISYTEQRAEDEAQKAIAALINLPASEYKDALELLARFSVQRNY
jgi:Geranylgeranyl pyrophosphate synthase